MNRLEVVGLNLKIEESKKAKYTNKKSIDYNSQSINHILNTPSISLLINVKDGKEGFNNKTDYLLSNW